jgi:hypothetical protein
MSCISARSEMTASVFAHQAPDLPTSMETFGAAACWRALVLSNSDMLFFSPINRTDFVRLVTSDLYLSLSPRFSLFSYRHLSDLAASSYTLVLPRLSSGSSYGHVSSRSLAPLFLYSLSFGSLHCLSIYSRPLFSALYLVYTGHHLGSLLVMLSVFAFLHV